MGKILSYKHGENSVAHVDPRLWDIVQHAIAAVPYNAQIRSGSERGKGDKGNHSKGYAVDVTLIDPNTGKVIPDTGRVGGVSSARIYEQYAQAARVYQKANYPELSNVFRWGGGFRQGGTPFDLMHLDITPKAAGAMAYYNWDTGFNARAGEAMPGLLDATSGGLGGVEGARLVSQYEQALAGSGDLAPPMALGSDAPRPANLTRGIDIARTKYAADLAGTPPPRPRPKQSPPPPSGYNGGLAGMLAGGHGLAQMLEGLSSPAAMSATPRLPDGFDFGDPRGFILTPEQQNRFGTPAVPMDVTGAQVRTAVADMGFGSMFGPRSPSMNAPNPLPRIPAPVNVKVPTGPTQDPIGKGASFADMQRLNPTMPSGVAAPVVADILRQGNSARDPIGDSARLADLTSFNPPSRFNTGQGIAGTVQLPHSVVPRLLPLPQPQTRTRTVMVPNPELGKVNPVAVNTLQDIHDREEARIMAAQQPLAPPVPQFIKKTITETLPPAPSAPMPRPYGDGVAARASAAQLVQGSNGYYYVPNPDGSYTSLKTQDEALARQRATASRPGTSPMLTPQGLPPIPRPYGSRPGLPALPGMVPGAVAIPRAQNLGTTLGDWWSRTLLGRIGNAVTGRPQAPFGGLLGMATGDVRSPFAAGGGSPFAASMGQHSAMLQQAAAAQALRDPLGAAIGAANRASPSPTYDVSGGNNSFNPQSIQNSSRWQTGY